MPSVGAATISGVPAVPAAGAVLLKETAADFDLRWAAARDGELAGSDPAEFSGRWTDYRAFKSAVSTGGSLTLSGSTVWYIPFFNPRPLAISAVGMNLTSGVNATFSFGFSAIRASTYLPGTLLASTSVTGALSGFAAALSFTIPQGWLYVSAGFTTNSGGYTVPADAMRPFYSNNAGGANSAVTVPAWPSAWVATSASAPVSNPPTGSWQNASYLPYIGFRIA